MSELCPDHGLKEVNNVKKRFSQVLRGDFSVRSVHFRCQKVVFGTKLNQLLNEKDVNMEEYSNDGLISGKYNWQYNYRASVRLKMAKTLDGAQIKFSMSMLVAVVSGPKLGHRETAELTFLSGSVVKVWKSSIIELK